MAKKKQHAKKSAPVRKETKKSSNLGWIIAAIVIIAVVALVVMQQGKNLFGKDVTQPTETPAKGALVAAAAPTMETKCLNPIGVIPGTRSGTLTVEFKNNGKTVIEGAYLEFTNAAGEKSYKMNSDTVQPGTTATYTVDLNQISSELGTELKGFVLYPIENGKACKNQRAYVQLVD